MRITNNVLRTGLLCLSLGLFGSTFTSAQALYPSPTKPQVVTPRAVPPASIRRPTVNSPGVPGAQPGTPPNALVWDKEVKQMTAEVGATNAIITFLFTNQHSSAVVIKNVRPSCGCTTMQLPSMPWTIPAGSNGQIKASLDLRGKRGTLTKSITVDSTSGYKSLLFKVTVPTEIANKTTSGEEIDPERLKNMKMAQVDRQVVFKNEQCATCHAEPAHGKMGEELYRAACAVCHDTPHRATMVPDLAKPKFPTSAPYWKYWIINGRPGSLMPAFSKNHGGPLTDEQIDSLVEYLTENITKKIQAATNANTSASLKKP